jgi:hypothetical protein
MIGKFILKIIMLRIGKKLFYKYRKSIYRNRKPINKIILLLLLFKEKRFMFHIRLIYSKYYIKVFSVTLENEDLWKELSIGLYKYEKSIFGKYNLVSIFYLKKSGIHYKWEHKTRNT